MDEGVISPIDLEEFIKLGMLDGVAMKPARCGGLASAKRQIEVCLEHKLIWLGTGQGVQKEDAVNTSFRWADLSTRELGAAIFVSSDHPGFPVAWLIRNSYAGVLNPSWPGLKPAVLQPEKPVVLRYRLYLHRGDAVAGGVREAYQRYQKSG